MTAPADGDMSLLVSMELRYIYQRGEGVTYKLNPEIRKILSPIVLIFPDGMKQKYKDGKVAADAVFDHKYLISTLRAVNDIVELKLVEQEAPNMNWSGESATSFF